jgi:hypothetical protein
VRKVNKKLLLILGFSLSILIGLVAGRIFSSPYSWDEEFRNTYPVKDLITVEKSIEVCGDRDSADCDRVMEEMPGKLRDANVYYSGYQFCLEKFGKSKEECGKLLNEAHLNEDFSQHLPSRSQ